jgi:hypothetical protein
LNSTHHPLYSLIMLMWRIQISVFLFKTREFYWSLAEWIVDIDIYIIVRLRIVPSYLVNIMQEKITTYRCTHEPLAVEERSKVYERHKLITVALMSPLKWDYKGTAYCCFVQNLLSFSMIHKTCDQSKQSCNFARCFASVWIFTSHVNYVILAEDITLHY